MTPMYQIGDPSNTVLALDYENEKDKRTVTFIQSIKLGWLKMQILPCVLI